MSTIPLSYATLDAALTQHPYSSLLLDAWGVFWAGNAKGPYPGSKETMGALVASGKKIGIVSNSTQLSEVEIPKFAARGLIQGTHFHFLITSGDVAKKTFLSGNLPFQTPNKKYLLFCPPHPLYSHPSSMFVDTPWAETIDPMEADFIYINVPNIDGENQEDPEVFRPIVRGWAKTGKPMVCVNPDRFTHEGAPPRMVVRQGSIASMYKEIGGEVIYIGKPYKEIFSLALDRLQSLSPTPKDEVLMIGDTPETDIRGARSFGIPAALITHTGIMGERFAHEGLPSIQKLAPTDVPQLFIERFA